MIRLRVALELDYEVGEPGCDFGCQISVEVRCGDALERRVVPESDFVQCDHVRSPPRAVAGAISAFDHRPRAIAGAGAAIGSPLKNAAGVDFGAGYGQITAQRRS